VEELKLLGQYVPVRARVVQTEALSAHADHAELIQWLRNAAISPRRVFVTHGEPSSSDAFRRRLVEAFGWNVVTPDLDSKAVLE
jgi:metallo-beta-lactamase family protein